MEVIGEGWDAKWIKGVKIHISGIFMQERVLGQPTCGWVDRAH